MISYDGLWKVMKERGMRPSELVAQIEQGVEKAENF